MTEQQFRNKITWFTFVLSLFVVWVHSYNGELYLGKTLAASKIYQLEHWIGDGIGQMAVPGFFMISAYLFYRNFSWEKLWEKWNSRIHSILVPFILWNFIYYTGYVISSRLPWMNLVVGKGVIPWNLFTAVDAVINYTYNYVFWYLYQLILLILLTPILYGILKHKVLGFLFHVLLWGLLVVGLELPQLNLDALVYYSFASYLAIHGSHRVEGGWTTWQGGGGMVLLLASMMLFPYGLAKGAPVFFVLSRFLAVIGLWMVVSEVWLCPVKSFMTYNFFLYATHFAFVRFINKAGTQILPAWPWLVFVLYLIMPLLVLMISMSIGSVLRRWAPPLWNILNGGR